MTDRATRAQAQMRRAALANLSTLGFRVTSIQVWRASSLSAGRVQIGTVDGGVLPSNLQTDLGLPSTDDLGGGRYPYTGYIGGTIALAAGDELRMVADGGTVRYAVPGAWNWNVIQVAGLSKMDD